MGTGLGNLLCSLGGVRAFGPRAERERAHREVEPARRSLATEGGRNSRPPSSLITCRRKTPQMSGRSTGSALTGQNTYDDDDVKFCQIYLL